MSAKHRITLTTLQVEATRRGIALLIGNTDREIERQQKEGHDPERMSTYYDVRGGYVSLIKRLDKIIESEQVKTKRRRRR